MAIILSMSSWIWPAPPVAGMPPRRERWGEYGHYIDGKRLQEKRGF
jgi:hypothetical protein